MGCSLPNESSLLRVVGLIGEERVLFGSRFPEPSWLQGTLLHTARIKESPTAPTFSTHLGEPRLRTDRPLRPLSTVLNCLCSSSSLQSKHAPDLVGAPELLDAIGQTNIRGAMPSRPGRYPSTSESRSAESRVSRRLGPCSGCRSGRCTGPPKRVASLPVA